MYPRLLSSGIAAFAFAAVACTDLRTGDDQALFAPPGAADHEAALVGHDPETCTSSSDAARCPPSTCAAKVMVIGCDDREFVPDGTNTTTTSPWRHVGRLSMGCTGTLIGPKHVLTAAHCVMNAGASAISFQLAKVDEDTCPLGTRYVKRVYRPAAFTGNLNENSAAAQAAASLDYAVLELWSGFEGAQPMQFDYVHWDDLSPRHSYSIGYPGTTAAYQDQRPVSTGTGDWGASPYRYLDNGEKGTLELDNDGEGGQSGAPVYVFIDGVRVVVGVLLGSPVDACEAGNLWASRLTPGAMEHIENSMAPATIDFFWSMSSLLPYVAPRSGC